MRIELNGETDRARTPFDGRRRGRGLRAPTPAGAGLAVALDGEVVPRGEWEQTRLAEGQRVEVVAAIQGGAGDGFELGGRDWGSRLIVGTGGFRSLESMEQALRLRHRDRHGRPAARRPRGRGSVTEVIDRLGLFARCPTPPVATRRATPSAPRKLAREAFETDWVKLEVIGDDRTLLPTRSSCSTPPSSSATTASRSCRTPTTTRSSPAASRRPAARR